MNRAFVTAAASGLFLLSIVLNLNADVRKRWTLDFDADKPFPFTYRDSHGHANQYWVLPFHVKNTGDVEVPLILDFNVKTIKSEDPVDLKNARTYHQGWFPLVENRVIAKLEGLGAMEGDALEAAAKKLQDGGKYLDSSLIRRFGESGGQDKAGKLPPGGEFTGLALFENVPWGFIQMEFLVSGLIDNVHFKEHHPGESEAESKIKYEFENRILRIIYKHPGDEFYGQFKPIDFYKKDWIVIPLGAVGDRKTLDLLVEGLSLNDDVARKSAGELLAKLTGEDFKYDASKSVADNADAIHNWRAWVDMHKFNLKWDDVKMQFVPK